VTSELRAELARRLTQARGVTEGWLAGLSPDQLSRQYDPEFSPIAWHYGHVAWQEECFIARQLGRLPPFEPALDRLFDPRASAKATRSSELPDRRFIADYAARVRSTTFELLRQVEFSDTDLLREGHAFRFIANHELQHAEIIATLRLMGGLTLADGATLAAAAEPAARARIAGGTFRLGSDDDPDRWDNEQRTHELDVPEFWLATRPVSSGEWLEFMRAGGYAEERLWTPQGFRWRARAKAEAPLHWRRGGDGQWLRSDLRGCTPVQPLEPVTHVCWHEACAFARFAGGRLPREPEWEKAARLAPFAGGMLGGVWEWVADAFAPYPGFRPQPYREYSEPWFDGRHRVARGGSYLSAPSLARVTFRNWYLEHIRQPVLGVRLAFDRA
jgi:iron(II)-dependent oxidoreductase